MSRLRATVCLVVVSLLLAACASHPGAVSGPHSPPPVSRLAAGTCWSAAALADGNPAFAEPESCTEDHRLEVYRVLTPAAAAGLTSYAVLGSTGSARYRLIADQMQQACMTPLLARVARRTRLPGAVAAPFLPSGMALSWAPPAPRQFAAGARGFACVFSQAVAGRTSYAEVFTSSFPTGSRTCILSARSLFVDCARKHDRERIAVIEARRAVAIGAFPGRKGIKRGPRGRYLAASTKKYAALDAACTAYLRAVSTTRKLTGIAEIDLASWPGADGSYPIVCEADTRPNQPPVITRGSVYDKS